jgi:hypothetical protein
VEKTHLYAKTKNDIIHADVPAHSHPKYRDGALLLHTIFNVQRKNTDFLYFVGLVQIQIWAYERIKT